MSNGDKKADEKKPDTTKKLDEKRTDTKKLDDKRADEKKPDDKKQERKPETQTPRKNETGVPGKRLWVDPTLQAVDALDVETVAIGLCSDVRPLAGGAGFIDWRMCGGLSELLRRGTITGKAGEQVLLPTNGMIPAGRILVFGWGPKSALLDNAVARLAWMAQVLTRAGSHRIAVALPEPAGILVGLVEEHLRKPLGERLSIVFGPDALMSDAKDTRPIPAAPPPSPPAPTTTTT
ncbi:MAG: hypothetical protein HYS27_21535 [Deltaproteobacteria bacterium]|nr:hypothetical protein [Deltaproteobacteria bacterium]